MADILNAGVIVLVAAFGLVAIVAGADQLRENAGPASSLDRLDDAAEAERSDTSDVETPLLGKHALDDDRDGKRGDKDRADRGDDGRRGDKDDEDGDDEDDDEDEDDD